MSKHFQKHRAVRTTRGGRHVPLQHLYENGSLIYTHVYCQRFFLLDWCALHGIFFLLVPGEFPHSLSLSPSASASLPAYGSCTAASIARGSRGGRGGLGSVLLPLFFFLPQPYTELKPQSPSSFFSFTGSVLRIGSDSTTGSGAGTGFSGGCSAINAAAPFVFLLLWTVSAAVPQLSHTPFAFSSAAVKDRFRSGARALVEEVLQPRLDLLGCGNLLPSLHERRPDAAGLKTELHGILVLLIKRRVYAKYGRD
jgi:hypothetical protein